MVHQCLAVIRSNATQPFLGALQKINSGFGNQTSLFVQEFSDKWEFRFPLNGVEQCTLVFIPHDGVDPPIPDPLYDI